MERIESLASSTKDIELSGKQIIMKWFGNGWHKYIMDLFVRQKIDKALFETDVIVWVKRELE